MLTEQLLEWCRKYREKSIVLCEREREKMNRTVTIKLKCPLCNAQAEIKVPIQSRENLFYIEIPERHCAKCFLILDQIIDGREKENGQPNNPANL